jgi:hypothetical protein
LVTVNVTVEFRSNSVGPSYTHPLPSNVAIASPVEALVTGVDVVAGAAVVAETAAVVVVGAGGGEVVPVDASSSDEPHAARIRIMTTTGATVLNCRRQFQ